MQLFAICAYYLLRQLLAIFSTFHSHQAPLPIQTHSTPFKPGSSVYMPCLHAQGAQDHRVPIFQFFLFDHAIADGFHTLWVQHFGRQQQYIEITDSFQHGQIFIIFHVRAQGSNVPSMATKTMGGGKTFPRQIRSLVVHDGHPRQKEIVFDTADFFCCGQS